MADDRWRDDEQRGWDEKKRDRGAREAYRGPGGGYRDRYGSDRDRSGSRSEQGYERARDWGEDRYGPDYGRRYGERGYDPDRGRSREAYGQPQGGRGYEQYPQAEPEWGGGWTSGRYRGMEQAHGQAEGGRGYEQHRGAAPQWDEGRTSGGYRGMERKPGGHRGRGPKGYVRSDERVREDVNDKLTYDPDVDASDIVVSVRDCDVTLDGTVASRHEKRRAEDCAESIRGVRNVQNNLRIESRAAEAAETGAAPGGVRASSSGTIRS